MRRESVSIGRAARVQRQVRKNLATLSAQTLTVFWGAPAGSHSSKYVVEWIAIDTNHGKVREQRQVNSSVRRASYPRGEAAS